jgi:hypothetical protein
VAAAVPPAESYLPLIFKIKYAFLTRAILGGPAVHSPPPAAAEDPSTLLKCVRLSAPSTAFGVSPDLLSQAITIYNNLNQPSPDACMHTGRLLHT